MNEIEKKLIKLVEDIMRLAKNSGSHDIAILNKEIGYNEALLDILRLIKKEFE